MSAVREVDAGPAVDEEPERSKLDRTWSWMPMPVAVGVVLAVVLLGLSVVIFGGRAQSPAVLPASQGPAAAPAPATVPSAAPAPTDQDLVVPTTSPQDIRWSDFQGVDLPYSPAAGPTRLTGFSADGYAHTPLGALLAACQIDVRSLLAPGGAWRDVVARDVAAGPGRDQFLAIRSSVGDGAPAGGFGQIAGFRFVDATNERAVIQLADRFTDGAYQVTTLTVRWSGFDWQLVLQPDGSSSPTAQPVQNLDGFVPFDGGSD